MRPRPITYRRPKTIAQALELLSAQSIVLNGGQAIIPTLRMRVVNPGSLVDIKGISELSSTVEVSEAGIQIGPRVTTDRLMNWPGILEAAPVLREAGTTLADAQIRAQGTAIGSLCWADPRANYPVAFLAMKAVVNAIGSKGRRDIDIDDFFAGFRANVLQNELVISVTCPGSAQLGFSTYREFSQQTNDVCIVNVAVAEVDGDLRVAVGGLDKRPQLVPHAAEVMAKLEEPATSMAFATALRMYPMVPIEDGHGSQEFKLMQVAELLAEIAAEYREAKV